MGIQTIQFDIEDGKLNTLLTLLENLKDGMIKNLTVTHDNTPDKETIAYMKTPQFQKDKKMLQQRLADIDSGKTTCVPWNEGFDDLDTFIHNAS
ncbi:hypothetical protein MNB_SV-3-885 [hydrothermal vent metagenome]|uniref:Uncharacterized protein n=1 Tax=hydrothermal vent metagenome TaxID=652676 RepID=A0A1W1BDW4_9ZZZZ